MYVPRSSHFSDQGVVTNFLPIEVMLRSQPALGHKFQVQENDHDGRDKPENHVQGQIGSVEKDEINCKFSVFRLFEVGEIQIFRKIVHLVHAL